MQSVTYTYTVTNTSPATTDPVTITSLVDDKAGNLLAAFKAANGGSDVLAYGALGDLQRDADPAGGRRGRQLHQRGERGGQDDEGNPTSDTATATVTLHGRAADDRHRQVGQPGDDQRGRGGRCRA